MSRMRKKAGILLCVFIAAIAVCFVLTQNFLPRDEERVYVSMEEASLPVVYVESMGREMNPLRGYVQEMDGTAADSLTILPEDRLLPVRIAGYAGSVTGIRYEIRSLDQEQLVERTSLETWENGESEVRASLPVQNLIARDDQYQLCLIVGLDDGREVRYYTRILWTGDSRAQEMVDLAADFSAKTFDYDQAMELTTYLEPDPSADNSSLGHVTLQSDFDQITWGGMDVQPLGEKRITLRELDGIMGNVELEYLVTDGAGSRYEVTENFTMKWDTQRIYMMSYDRTMNEIFSGSADQVSGRRILLGISDNQGNSVAKSENGRYTVFVANRDLWQFDQGDGGRSSLVQVFSFCGEDQTDVRDNFACHNIKILSADDGGNVDFLIYGYMNRGTHEGNVGVSYCRYDQESRTLEERFFIPVTMSFGELAADVSRLAKLGGNGMLYMYLNGFVYAVDLSSNEYLVAASGLREGSYAVSQDQSRLAWQDGSESYGAETIHVMNLETGAGHDIQAAPGEWVKALGFVENDFIYGMADQGDLWMEGSRVIGLPVYRLQIVDDQLNVQADYEKEGIYISGVRVVDGRIHLEQMVKSGTGYEKTGEDIIVCNTEVRSSDESGIGWYGSDDRKRLYFVQLDKDAADSSRIRVSAPENLAYDRSDVLELRSAGRRTEAQYRAYGNGRMLGVTENLADAISLCYGAMGYVADENGCIVWNRVDRPNAYSIRDGVTAAARLIRYLDSFGADTEYSDGIRVMDAGGASLRQVLYYVGKGCPVAAYEDDGSYRLITGYDQNNVTVLNPATGESIQMKLEDGEAYYSALRNNFVCGLFTE